VRGLEIDGLVSRPHRTAIHPETAALHPT
jgi:hypothetical protein